ncbi:MAG: hypothetical protein F6K39_46040 [Okeania sp. SIO3B3]|nr:hypothetical protein [Okeania sp. SIO3B3]
MLKNHVSSLRLLKALGLAMLLVAGLFMSLQQAAAYELVPAIAAKTSLSAPLADFTGCATATQISESECEALVALYNNTDGSNWITKTNWLQTDEPCDWYGVTCNQNGDSVVQLNLQSNNLSGTIPATISQLSNLIILRVPDNQITSVC